MTNYAKIYDDAIAHFGLVSTARAKALGVSALQLLKLARSGRLERVGCGLYRIAAALRMAGLPVLGPSGQMRYVQWLCLFRYSRHPGGKR